MEKQEEKWESEVRRFFEAGDVEKIVLLMEQIAIRNFVSGRKSVVKEIQALEET